LNEEEKETKRLLRLRNSHYRGGDDCNKVWIKPALTDPFVWLLDIAFFTSSVAITGFVVFLPAIIAGLGYEGLSMQYMTIPVYALGACCLATNVYFSDEFKRRGVFLVDCCFPVFVGCVIYISTPNKYADLGGMFVLVLGKYRRSLQPTCI